MVVRDQGGKILSVREADPRVHGKLNFPGGHVEGPESVCECAMRELREETGIDLVPIGVLGVYVQGDGIYFVFHVRAAFTETTPGQDILSCEWLTPEQVLSIPDSEILRPSRLRSVVADLVAGIDYPIELVRDLSGGE
jgi:8-oxo-dGTP pyrophosphatase MutT (NUDIX family)